MAPHAADRRRHDSGGRSAGRATGSCRACGSAPRIVERRHPQRLQAVVLHGGRFTWATRRKAIARTSGGRRSGGAGGAGGSPPALAGTTPVGRSHPVLSGRGYQPTSTRDGCSSGCARGPPLLFDPDRAAAVPHTAPAHGDGVAAPAQRGTGAASRTGTSVGPTCRTSPRRGVPGSLTAPAQREDHPRASGYAQTHRRRRSPGPASNARPGSAGTPVIVMGDLNSYASRQPQARSRSCTTADSSTPSTLTNAPTCALPDGELHPATRH